MLQRVVTNAAGEKLYVTIDGDVLDRIARTYYGRHESNTEALLDANPGLAERPMVLPAGVVIKLPEIQRTVTPTPFRQLWD